MSQRYAERLEALHTAPVSVPTVGDPMLVTLRAAMHTNFVALLEHEVECRRDKNIEALRTMLRAVFQLRALVKIAEDDFDQKTIKKAGKRLRKLSRCLADVHELDVMMRDILHYGAALSHRRTIATIVAHLDAQRLLAKAQLIEYLDSKKYRKFLKRFQAFLLAPADEVLDLTPIDDPTAPSEVRHLLPVVLHQQLAKIRAYDTFMDASDNEVFVAMRNDVWLFRYTLT
ncbi:MAG: CHAD domain-containing protein, partial [Chloroflexota bacterium]